MARKTKAQQAQGLATKATAGFQQAIDDLAEARTLLKEDIAEAAQAEDEYLAAAERARERQREAAEEFERDGRIIERLEALTE